MKRGTTAFLLLMLLPVLTVAQAPKSQDDHLLVVFVGGSDLTVNLPNGITSRLGIGFDVGEKIPLGATIITGPSTSVELVLVPNKSIIKLGEKTEFKLLAAVEWGRPDSYFLDLSRGRLRFGAAKGLYEIRTPAGSVGIRGTDLVVTLGTSTRVAVLKGLVEFRPAPEPGWSQTPAAIYVRAGMAVDSAKLPLEPFTLSEDAFQREFGDLAFQRLIAPNRE